MSVSLFIASLPYWIWVIFGYIQFWMRYLFQIFWKHSLDVCTLVLNNFRFLVCLSVCSLRHFLTKIMLSSSRWAIFFKCSAEISGILVHYLKIISDFLYVCWSVHCLTSLLKLGYLWIYPVLDEISFPNFLKTFLRCLYTSFEYFRFLVCLSVCSLRHFLTKIMLSSSRWAIFFKFSAEISGILVH